MKFVEAQKPGLVENRPGGERDHIAVGDFAARNILTIAIDPLVHFGHEFVKMRAALVLDLAVLEKQIHQHGLAAPDIAMNIKPARRRTVLVGKQPAQQALLAQGLVAREPPLEVREGVSGLRLRGVGLDRAGCDESVIMGAERGGWSGQQHGPFYGPNVKEIASHELMQGLCGGCSETPRRLITDRHTREKLAVQKLNTARG